MNEPTISVIVCTQNRGPALSVMLDSLVAMDVPDDLNWELVMVDNASTDQTPEVIAGYADKLPLVSIKEPQPGLSFARNCGVAAARGQHLVWTDDDVRVSKDWLAAYRCAFEKHPDAGYFGGPIRPVMEGQTPAWLTDNLDRLGSHFARRELGDTERAFTDKPGDNPFGANYAIRADVQRQYAYPTYLGVSPKFRRSGEEVAVLKSVRGAGFTGYWIPDASVEHMIPETRQTLKYIENYHRAIGETWAVLSVRREAYQDLMGEPIDLNGRTIAGVPVWIWRKTLSSGIRLRLARLFGGSRTWMPHLMEHYLYRGASDYLYRTATAKDA